MPLLLLPKLLKLLLVLIVLAAVAAAAYLRVTYHQWPWQALPDRLPFCDRIYLPAGGATSDEVRARGDRVIGHLYSFRGIHEVWGQRSGPVGDRCGAGVYVRTGTTTFRQYSLSGGP